jgi:predicted HTH transcriptional regulator
LEFKQKADATNGELAKVDRRNLAEVLSAFSNSMGGLIVWGIEAKKNR